MGTRRLIEHQFAQQVWRDARPVLVVFRPRITGTSKPGEILPDEHEFYIWRAGSALAALLSASDRLVHSVVFLSAYRQTKALQEAAITRTDHLTFGIENFIIRTQVIYDRVLRLVDAVFDLRNDEQMLTHKLVTTNLRIRHSTIVPVLKRIQKKTRQYSEQRNKLLHRGTWQDDDSYLLELATQLDESYKAEGGARPPEVENLDNIRREETLRVLKKKRREFLSFSDNLTDLLAQLLEHLKEPYEENKKNLARGLGKKTT
jgi:hypothetical protein